MNNIVMLIGFYNEKALGVKYLSNSLKKEGYEPHIVFFKEFNSIQPTKATNVELGLLTSLIDEIKPSYIGLSVMSSLYLETVYLVNNIIKRKFNIPIIWGGVYATLFPDKALEHGDYVIQGEGEEAIVELLEALSKNIDISRVENLAYRDKNGEITINEVRPLKQKLDELVYPQIGGENNYLIYNDSVIKGDPQLKDMVYEMSASRGCPFTCSYCSSINLKRLYTKKGKYVRFRSVDSVLKELSDAKNSIKNLKLVHFWDEIFSDDPNWINEFKIRYKKEIGLPFKIWGHPLKINKHTIEGLVDAGLYQIVVGIQSGSPRVRRDIFHRTETSEDIINASKILSECRVPRVIYDFMLQHPFETMDDLIKTYELCLQLEHPFELQLHGLNFLPGTDIVQKAIEEGHFTEAELEKIMYGTISEQYDMYWGPAAANSITEDNVWISLIYLTQFHRLRPIVELLASEAKKGHKAKVALTLKKIMARAKMVKNISQKAKLVIGRK